MAKHVKHASPDLDDALEHVVYEMWKYKQSVAYYAPIQQAGGDAALEFRVLHHRVLLDFFYGRPSHRDDIVAWEYVHGWAQTHNPTTLPWLKDYMIRCHTMLAHLSTTRTAIAKRGGKSWGKDWLTVEPHLNLLIGNFLSSLPAHQKKICREWVTTWSTGSYPCNDALRDLAAALV